MTRGSSSKVVLQCVKGQNSPPGLNAHFDATVLSISSRAWPCPIIVYIIAASSSSDSALGVGMEKAS